MECLNCRAVIDPVTRRCPRCSGAQGMNSSLEVILDPEDDALFQVEETLVVTLDDDFSPVKTAPVHSEGTGMPLPPEYPAGKYAYQYDGIPPPREQMSTSRILDMVGSILLLAYNGWALVKGLIFIALSTLILSLLQGSLPSFGADLPVKTIIVLFILATVLPPLPLIIGAILILTRRYWGLYLAVAGIVIELIIYLILYGMMGMRSVQTMLFGTILSLSVNIIALTLLLIASHLRNHENNPIPAE